MAFLSKYTILNWCCSSMIIVTQSLNFIEIFGDEVKYSITKNSCKKIAIWRVHSTLEWCLWTIKQKLHAIHTTEPRPARVVCYMLLSPAGEVYINSVEFRLPYFKTGQKIWLMTSFDILFYLRFDRHNSYYREIWFKELVLCCTHSSGSQGFPDKNE